MLITRRKLAGALTTPVLLLAGCNAVRQTGEAFGHLFKLQQDLAQVLGHRNMAVLIMNGTLLRIDIINSPWSQLPPAQRQDKAKEICRLAYDKYLGRDTLDAVSVQFSTHRSILFLIHINTTDGGATVQVRKQKGAVEGSAR